MALFRNKLSQHLFDNRFAASRAPARLNWLCDLTFMAFAAVYALLALQGIISISGHGVQMDSDLATYAQAMTKAEHPDYFDDDPVLARVSPGLDIHNLERWVATALMPNGDVASGLFRAGALAIFIFYCGWYMLGRWLFGRPAIAALLAVICGITVWIEYGTFWGINHSDPVPRVWFAALFPLLLLCAIAALRNGRLRPATMFLTGLCIWVHGVSALNCGAMFFVAFVFFKPRGYAPGTHLGNLFVSLCAFLLPVLVFLWPSLMQKKNFSAEELDVFRELFVMRWKEDYSDPAGRLLRLCTSVNSFSMLGLGAICAWLITLFYGNEREKTLARACPAFILALFMVAFFSFAETRYAPGLGRLPMGHELVRGIRFIVPLSMLLIIAAVYIIIPSILIRPGVCLSIALVAIFSVDRQYAGAQYALTNLTGVELPLSRKAAEMHEASEKRLRFLDEIGKIVPRGEAIFSEDEDMALRYHDLRPLAHAFKDGYIHFYNKDLEGSRKWLEMEKILAREPNGLYDAWQRSGAPWLLCRDSADRALLEEHGRIVLEKDGWLLARKI